MWTSSTTTQTVQNAATRQSGGPQDVAMGHAGFEQLPLEHLAWSRGW